ncbi:unnamed protein product [Closterium sp. Naga37s-1]|nr:unnamed protein product [Closterium sp. Naga37s-1]
MPRQPKKAAQPVSKPTDNGVRESASTSHHLEPATPRPMLKEVGGPFADETRISLVKKLNDLKFSSLEDRTAEGSTEAGEEKKNTDEVSSPAVALEVPAEGEEEEEDEDDGYLSDDPEERFDPVKAGEIAARAGFSITLLIPIKYEEEVERTIDTVKGLLALWRKYMSAHVLTTTKCQVLLPAWLSKKRYGRLQVTFQQASDANYAWCRRVEHKMLNGVGITLDWQHPENPLYIMERAKHPDSVEVLLKSVPAAITPEMVYEYLVTAVLEKRGRTPFLSGSAFHRVVDPVTGADTDKIRGLVKGHPGDKYRWWHLLTDSVHHRQLLVHFPSLSCDFCNGMHMTKFHDDYVTERQENIGKWNLTLERLHAINAASLPLDARVKKILRDPALVLISTGGSREDWLCVQEACGKVHGSSFSQALVHVKSVQHCTALLQGGSASRRSRGKMNLIPVRKEFGLQK